MSKPPRKTVWITRTQPSARESARAFQAAGYNVITAPLLTVEFTKQETSVPENAVLIFTSQNGVRAFCAHEVRRAFPVVTVGDATANLAREFGFTDVRSAGGTSDDIAPLITRTPNPDALHIHISGHHVRGSVTQDLRDKGLQAQRRIYYRSVPVQILPDIKIEDVDIAVFFSPLAAQTLAGLSPDTAHITAVSISTAADSALSALPFKSRRIAVSPTLESLIAATATKG